ncbi:hypothetical protein HNE_0956 [Hyphomonas neptunium ATCC 15444]|uniref:Uncharacterized protein n=2 Tax=Hyphomonas TaxID=85 RepID=Q0C3L1_HYPNA|nr:MULTISPECIES: hypothetical protein [Hyphomonas]ABI78147.1 hypothetical protein HNE_0956 [Hyphomonas neptunium ATCC 15444]KCZ96107.1 hypothetical protein HHI_00470 [Hyphomonas hirschiana VP5]
MQFLTRAPILWALFLLMILAGAAFQIFAPQVGGAYLDMVADPGEVRALFEGLSPEQKTAHFWVTVLVDTLFPLSFGLLFAGMALRFFGRWGKLAALPGFAVIIFDLTENTVQALALSGTADALDAKAWLTPLKFGLFWLAAAIALIAALIGIYRLATRRKA